MERSYFGPKCVKTSLFYLTVPASKFAIRDVADPIYPLTGAAKKVVEVAKSALDIPLPSPPWKRPPPPPESSGLRVLRSPTSKRPGQVSKGKRKLGTPPLSAAPKGGSADLLAQFHLETQLSVTLGGNRADAPLNAEGRQ